MADDKLKMGLSLDVDIAEFEQEWKQKQKEIQKIIDSSTFKIKIDGIEGLDKIRDTLRDIQQMQGGFSKPLTGAQALREQLKHEERARLANAKAMEFEAGSADRLRRQKAQAELSELRLARAKEKGTKATYTQTQAYRTQAGVLNGLKQFTNSYISLLGGYRLLSNIRQITSEFELQRVSLRAITQDAAFADALFSRIKTTATESPFATKDLVTYTKQLAAYRIENEQLYGTMNMLADISAGLGVSMDRLILAYGQVKAASVLRGTELRQFTEAGIPLVDELARKFSQLRGEVVSTGEVFDLISTRKVPFEMVADIFKEMTAEGGRFYEMQKKQSESLYGVYENLKDNIQNAFDEIGQSNKGLLMGFGQLATLGAKNLNILAAAVAPLVAGMGAYRAATVLATKGTLGLSMSSNLLARAEASLNRNRTIGNEQLRLQQRLMIRAAAAQNKYAIAILEANAAQNFFIRGLYLLKAAILANPIGAVLVGLTAVVSALSAYGDKLRSVERAQERATQRGEEFKKQAEQDVKLDGYNKIVESLKEQETLLKSAKMSYEDFQKTFPKLSAKYRSQEEREKALADAQSNHQRGIAQLKTEYNSYFGYLDAEKSKVSDLARGYADMGEEMRKVRLEQLYAARDEAQGALEDLQRRSESTVNKWWSGEGFWKFINPAGAVLEALGVPMNAAKAQLGPAASEVANYQSQIEALLKVIDNAEKNMVRWRKNYKAMVDKTIGEDELANLSFIEAADKANELLADLQEEQKDLKNIPIGIIDKEQINRLKELEALIPSVKRWLEMYKQFKQDDDDKKDLAPTDALKAELSLVEKIYKRYGDLRKLMSDEAAKADIKEIYGNLTNVDFLDPAAFKTRLEKMLKQAQLLGDDKLAMEIGLKIQDVDLATVKEKLQSTLDNLSNQIKQQQDASEFFEKILGLTGDVELSAKLALGVTGITVSDEGVGGLFSRKLAEVLVQEPVAVAVPADFQIEGDWNADNIQKAINSGKVTVAQIRDVIENLRSMGKGDLANVLEDSLQQLSDYSGNAMAKMYDVLRQYGDIEQKRIDITNDANTRIKTLEAGLVEAAKTMGDAELKALKQQTDAAIQGINASAALELFKLEDDYVRFFTAIYSMSVDNAIGIKNKIRDALYEAFEKGALSANELRKELKAVDAQFKKLSEDNSLFGSYRDGGIDGLIKKYEELADNISSVGIRISKLNDPSKISDDDKSYIDKMLKRFAPEYDGQEITSYEQLFKTFAGDTGKMGGFLQQAGTNMASGAQGFGGALMIVDRIIKDVHATISGIQGLIDQLNETRSEDNKIGDWFKYISDFDEYAFSGWEKLKSGDAIGATFDVISSIVSIFNNVQRDKIRRLNKEIERQADIIRDLGHAYDRLEEAQESLVGSDWIRNQQYQLKNLQRQLSATRAQLDAERAKGKSAEKDAIQDYEDAILDLEAQIRDTQKEILSEMAGTDLASAAKDLAQTWLDAYLSLDDTMGAIKGSFKEMMSSMVQNSMMAKLVQKRLEPVFEAIDKAYEDADLTPAEWQSIMDMGNRAIEYIDEDLTHLAEMLGLREQLGDTADSALTGIAKGVAQASEETVLTLAGYANSILYYQIWLKNDVAAIRAILEGKVAAVAPATSSEGGFNVGQLVGLQQQSLSQLQAINMNTGRSADSLSRLEDKIDSIISTAGTSSRKVVNTRLSN